MTIKQIADIIQAPPSNSTTSIAHLLTDSRRMLLPAQSLFFALKGMRQDGHDFIADAYAKGVRNFVISGTINTAAFPDANFLRVANVHEAIHQLVRFHRQQFELPIIGITGSNGKTIVKEWLFQVLQDDFSIVRSPRSYNSQLGVPLSVWQLQASHTLGIFEAGISRMGEMEKVAPIIDCTLGIFTNIGEAHSEGFASIDIKIKEKLRLFQSAESIIYCQDDSRVHQAMQALKGKRFFTWSRENAKTQVDLQIIAIQEQETACTITGIYKKEQLHIRIPFKDEPSIENAIHCWAAALFLGLEQKQIQQKMQQLEAVAMRLEMRAGIHDCSLINDSYNSDLTSLGMALNFLEQQSKHEKRSLILSDILQSGQEEDALYQAVAQLIEAKQIQKIIGIGEAIFRLQKMLSPAIEAHFFKHTDAFLDQIQLSDFQNEAILLKGARRFQFERIANFLAEKVHRTVLEVNIKALLHNLNVFSSYLKPSTKILMMVKAAAYGSGSVEVARLLEFQNIDYLAVAYTDEGVELREAGIKLPILVLNPEEATFETLIRHELEAEIYSLSLLKEFIRYIPEGSRIPIHLKLNTGMNRLGFEAKHIPKLIQLLGSEPRLYVQSIFSHFSASEAPQHDDFTHLQAQRFVEMYEQIVASIGYRPMQHIANTSGIVRFPEYQFDMVRLGVGLYGLENGKTMQDQLQIVNTLKARVSQIKEVTPEETVGYSRSGHLARPSRIATVSIGYADGLHRSAGNGRFSLLVRGKRAPILGNVCMDMCMLDVTDIPDVVEGDEVIVFGNKPHVDELAAAIHTIPLEIFTSISQRVKRVYFEE